MKIYDISRTISTRTAEWPGDKGFSFIQTASLSAGDSANLTAITMSPHLGTHIDAPWHFATDGSHPESLDLRTFIGPAQVLTIPGTPTLITFDHVKNRLDTGIPRLLLHTNHSSIADDVWDSSFAGVDPDLIDTLAINGISLIGMDMPSIDPASSLELPAHTRAGINQIAILENLQLDRVPDGVYDLIALPLKFAEICGSPVRAILIASSTV